MKQKTRTDIEVAGLVNVKEPLTTEIKRTQLYAFLVCFLLGAEEINNTRFGGAIDISFKTHRQAKAKFNKLHKAGFDVVMLNLDIVSKHRWVRINSF